MTNAPLPPLDKNGTPVTEGATVLIPQMPLWLTHDLPKEDVDALRVCEGTTMSISEIDAYGYVWFSSTGTAESDEHSRWFCLKPSEIVVISN